SRRRRTTATRWCDSRDQRAGEVRVAVRSRPQGIMPLLGSLSLWVAFLVGLWGAITGFVGGTQDRADLQQSARHATLALFITVMLFAANPFERLAFVPLDGRGMNPQLQNPGMVFHPPMLYLGYISITIPFAFAIAALLSKRLDSDWLVAIRKWTLVSWLFLSIGL